MSLDVTVSLANPDPNVNPTTTAGFIDLIRTLITAVVPGSYLPYVVSSVTPSVDDQNKVWHKVDDNGRPLGTYMFYSGNWRREYNGVLGEVRLFSGNPSGNFDGTGKGILGSDWDGWALQNGNNGTVDASDKFIVTAHMNDEGSAGYSSGWRTTVNGAPASSDDGTLSFTITDDNLPKMETRIVGNRGDDPGADQTPLKPIIDDDYKIGEGMETTLTLSTFGQEEPDEISLMPPFLTYATAQFIGYT